jgi:hypothetical protein
MTARTLVITTPVLLGAAVTAASGTCASSDTMTISCTTAQSCINMANLFLRITNQNTVTTAYVTLSASDRYSSKGIGAKSITAIATDSTVIMGGTGFCSARFLSSAETLVFTSVGTGPTAFEAYQSPNNWE